jgi:hypothetical protein
MKRILAGLIALVIVCASLPARVFAAGSGDMARKLQSSQLALYPLPCARGRDESEWWGDLRRAIRGALQGHDSGVKSLFLETAPRGSP